MSLLITTDEELRAFLPNIISTVKGEMPFINRLDGFLATAEEWVGRVFTSPTLLREAAHDPAAPLRPAVTALVVTEALRLALPSLDIVLTPNGFGVVSTQNVAPASKPRVDRLMESLVSARDEHIAALLCALRGVEEWHATAQARWFGATLSPDLAIIDALGHSSGSKWERYHGVRLQAIDLEASIAEDYVSEPLMEALRSELLRGTITPLRRKVAETVSAQVVQHMTHGSFNARSLANVVNLLRHNPEIFPEWHGSATAALFSPPKFANRKESGGYFF